MYLQNKKPCSCFRKQEHLEYQNFVFSWNIIFMSGINWSDWLCLNTLKAQHRVQWVATPLSWYTHFSSPHGVDQVPQFCLHRIELQPSRTAIQRLIPLNQVGDVNSGKVTVYIIQAVRNSCSPLRSGSRRRQKGPVRTPQIEQSQV